MSIPARRWWAGVTVAALAVGCTGAPDRAPSTPAGAVTVNPARIKRVGGQFPPGYERADTVGVASPAGIWGLGVGATAEPPRCAVLADPADADTGAARGLSGSGPGGILYAVVAPDAAGAPDPAVLATCASWRMSFARTTVSVELVPAPPIDGADTLGMSSNARTFVEGGSEIDSRAYTYTAYLGGYRAMTALIVDPGSPHPPLDPRLAADLLATTVAALRG